MDKNMKNDTEQPVKITYDSAFRDAEGNERVEETDSYIRIRDKQYHIEFQSRADDTMVLRMTDYDFQIALANRKLIQCVVKPLALAMGI